MLLEQKDRRVVPRWRDFGTTLALGELTNLKPREPALPQDREAVLRRAEEFQASPSIWSAADLLSSAFVVGEVDKFQPAVDFVLANQDFAPRALVSFARGVSTTPREQVSAVPELDGLSESIHRLRTRLQQEPHNAIRWVDLSRLYTLIGDTRRAVRSMLAAASIAPDNRFVVRSAARLFLHEHDPAKALDIIRKASGAKQDPWLLSAEIAVSSASHSPSLFAKIGTKRSEDDSLSRFARTELASAVATLEMENGKVRRARQLFRQSVISPNENSVAQIEWANRQIGGLEIPTQLLEIPKSFEASAQLNLLHGEWRQAVQQGAEWLRDQPFSKRPAIFTSYVASLIEDYSQSIEVLKRSLTVNPDDPMLINNLAFALASANRLEEAITTLNTVDVSKVTGTLAITLAATSGLVLFRTGSPDRGRQLYRLAIQRARSQGIPKYRVMADLYLAREELIAGTSHSETAVKRALLKASKVEDREVAFLADRVQKLRTSAIAESERKSIG